VRTVLAVLIFAVMGVGAGYLVIQHYFGQIGRVGDLPAPPTPTGSSSLRTSGQNFLLVGSDTRDNVGGGFGSADSIGGQRSDTVILAHLPAGSAKPTLVSFPRDSYVQIPAYTDRAGATHPAHMDKLNTAFADDGYALLVRTIEQLTGLTVNHYVEVNFAGFQRMVDALNGVTLCARTTRNDPANGASGGSNDFMTAGVHHNVSGAVALAFVRDRHSFPDQDISRILDQQYFLAQMIRKVESAGTLLNPFKLNAFLNAVTHSMRVDNGLSLGDIRTLVSRLRHSDPAHVRFVTVPFTTSNGSATISGVTASVVLLDAAKDKQLFDRLRTDSAGTSGHHAHSPGVSGKGLTCGA
jgi:LCP family protein required for cell wall assembly